MNPPSTTPSPTSSSFAALSRRKTFSPATFSGDRAASPQWGKSETAELIRVRGELEADFAASKRNKSLWENVACRMSELGFVRTPYQCKCKWKNLLIRYKGKETSDPGDGKECPFFDELHAVFSESAKNSGLSSTYSQQVAIQSRKRLKSNSDDQLSDNFSQDADDDAVDYTNETSNIQKRKASLEKHVQSASATDQTKVNLVDSVMEMLKGFFQQQQMIDTQWRDSMERHRRERQLFEQEWRQSMENIERERLKLEHEWREIEEQRQMKDEVRSQKRDVILTSLLNQLINDAHDHDHL
ncbi:hypothetical protein RND81_13G005400 [Saponaria officinalis]|uniref:Myb-like domain-containing protein n=1 Tax=Saponaria officinalis TaxID=3572 RepID=A0AAW1GUN1_SAPOF